MTKRLRDRSQFYPDLEELPVNLTTHSQLGSGYKLAEIGDLDEAYDRLAKYDREDLPLDLPKANDAINYFLSRISNCSFIDENDAYNCMDMSKSIGYGAQQEKIFARLDPKMKDYLFKYLELSKRTTHHVIINASQKDELRVEDKTPRLFTSFPPEHTFLATVVLGDFLDKFLENRFCVNNTISTVGDSTQLGAGKYYYDELSKRPYVYCTDTSAQDSSVSAEFINLVYDSIKLKFDLTEEESNMFEAVRFNSINKMMNINGDLYLVPRGLGSGDYLTIVINIMWRYYMFLEAYNHDYKSVLKDNTILICGDDFACSSNYDDLELSSKHAKIEWSGKPSSWSEVDFCSIKFFPYVRHDPSKVRAVLSLRKKKQHQLNPDYEMARLGGLLRVLSDEPTYKLILSKMSLLSQKYPSTNSLYNSLYISYDDLFECYNSYYTF